MVELQIATDATTPDEFVIVNPAHVVTLRDGNGIDDNFNTYATTVVALVTGETVEVMGSTAEVRASLANPNAN